jgi:hypothetical protein
MLRLNRGRVNRNIHASHQFTCAPFKKKPASTLDL